MTLSARLQSVPKGNVLPQPPLAVPVGEFLPDFPSIQNPGTPIAYNCVPKETGIYGPWRKQVVESTNSMDARCNGAILSLNDDLQAFIYTGNATKLYEYASPTFTDASKVGGYTETNAVSWKFARYDNRVIATNLADPVQTVNVGEGGTTPFADLITSTNKPRAAALATVDQFLVLGYTIDATDGTQSRRIWWSGFNDPTTFDPDVQTQSDFEDLSDGGNVTAIVGGVEYGVVFQAGSITRMTYIGPPQIFRFEAVDRLRGCRYPRSIISHGRLIFYWSDEGFMQFDGTTSRPIGAGKVDKTFGALLTPSNGPLMSGNKDTENNLAIWAIPDTGEYCTRVFIYNWTTGRWSEGQIDAGQLVVGVSPGVLVDDLVGVIIDDEPFASSLIDSGQFRGGQLRIGAVDSLNRMSWITGNPRAAQIGTKESEIFPGEVSQVRAVRPYVDIGMPRVQLTYRNKQTDNLQTTDEVEVGQFDRANFRDRVPVARYLSARMIFEDSQNWNNARSVDVWADPRGVRNAC